MTTPTVAVPARQMHIDFLFRDLDTCTRCRATDATLQQALGLTRAALDAVGVTPRVTKTLVATEAQAREWDFVSSPTIRIDGVDIAGDLVESACDSCTDGCACNGGVDCRDWVYRGQRSTEPPVGLIIEALMRHAAGPPPGDPPSGDTPAAASVAASVPDNLRRYFRTAASPSPAPSCCGAGTVATAGCGCHA